MKRKLIRKGSIVKVYLDESFIGFGKVLNHFFEPDGDNPERKLLYYTVLVLDENPLPAADNKTHDLSEMVYNNFEIKRHYGRIARWKLEKLKKKS